MGRRRKSSKVKYCPKKRETDSLGGIKIQFHGKPNEYGYQHIQTLKEMPKELEPLFFESPQQNFEEEENNNHNEATTANNNISREKFIKNNNSSNNANDLLLWSQFWKDVLSVQENCTTTYALLNLGFVSSLLGACLAHFKFESIPLLIVCLIMMFGFFHFMMKNQVNNTSQQDSSSANNNNNNNGKKGSLSSSSSSSSRSGNNQQQDDDDNYILQVNSLLEQKYNIPYFRSKKWVAKCHSEIGVSSINQRPQTYYIIHFTPIRKKTIQFS